MEQTAKEINDINDKLVEIYGKLIKIQYRLDTLEGDDNDVKTKPINQSDSRKSSEQRVIQALQRPNK